MVHNLSDSGNMTYTFREVLLDLTHFSQALRDSSCLLLGSFGLLNR